MLKKYVNIFLSFAFITTISACSETKDVKVEEKTIVTDVPVVDKEPVNVNVKIEQKEQQPDTTKDTTNVIIKDDSSKEVAIMNANIQKLQSQITTANAQSKAEIVKQIQQMNIEKTKLQQQVVDLQNQNKLTQEKIKKDELDKISNENLSITKEQYKNSSTSKLESFDMKLSTLRDKSSSFNDVEKSKIEVDISRLEDKKQEIENKVREIELSNNIQTLKIVKSQIDLMMLDLDKKYNNVISTKVYLR